MGSRVFFRGRIVRILIGLSVLYKNDQAGEQFLGFDSVRILAGGKWMTDSETDLQKQRAAFDPATSVSLSQGHTTWPRSLRVHFYNYVDPWFLIRWKVGLWCRCFHNFDIIVLREECRQQSAENLSRAPAGERPQFVSVWIFARTARRREQPHWVIGWTFSARTFVWAHKYVLGKDCESPPDLCWNKSVTGFRGWIGYPLF